MAHRETPTRRTNPSGKTVFVARYTDQRGNRRSAGTFKLRRDAQDAIDAAYEADRLGPALPQTIGAYASSWTQVHPRGRNTDATYEARLRAVLDVKVEGRALRDWRFDALRRRHANALADHMLRVQGRACVGVNGILATLSAMIEDAIEDEAAIANPFKGMKRVRANDPRIQKARRPVRVWSWDEMHALAAACSSATGEGAKLNAWRRVYAEPMIRTKSDCGLRIGEVFPLCVSDLDAREGTLQVRWSVSAGRIEPGTKTDHGDINPGRVVPIPPALLAMLKAMPKRLDAKVRRGGREELLLFPTPRGSLWAYQNWHRDVWRPGLAVAGVDARPHELRHSWVSLMRAALIDVADLADAAGHSPETQTKTYLHALNRSFEAMRRAVGE